MITLVLMDDEYYFRKAVRKYIEEVEGYRVLGEAKNGKEGFEMIKNLKPDIALVDINMPLMNGIEVAEAIKEQKIKCQVIILTGYSMFEYAQQSIRLGVHDYLLKPIDKPQLIEALSNAKNKIQIEHSLAKRNEDFKARKLEISGAIRDHFISKVICAKTENDWNEITLLIKEFPGLFEKSSFLIILIDLYLFEGAYWKEDDINICRFLVINILSELYEAKKLNCIAGTLETNKLCILISSDENAEELSVKNKEVLGLFEKVIKQDRFKISLLISIGSAKPYLYDIWESYDEANLNGKLKSLYQEKGVFYYDQMSVKRGEGMSFLSDNAMHLMSLMRSNKEAEISFVINSFFAGLKEKKVLPEIVYRQVNEILSCSFEVAQNTKSLSDEEGGYKWSLLPPEITKLSIDEMEQRVIQYVLQITREINAVKGEAGHELTQEVIRYIEKNFKNSDLSLEDLSRQIGISKTSLCQHFKVVTNTTIGEYLLQIRMLNAKRRFDNGFTNISFVAEDSGYPDAGYFSKRFKKYYGISPSDYVKRV